MKVNVPVEEPTVISYEQLVRLKVAAVKRAPEPVAVPQEIVCPDSVA